MVKKKQSNLRKTSIADKIVFNDNFQEHEEAMSHHFPWLTIEPRSMSFVDRMEVDFESYVEYLSDPMAPTNIQAVKDEFIDIMIDKIDSTPQLHIPYFMLYSKFLKDEKKKRSSDLDELVEEYYSRLQPHVWVLKSVTPPVIGMNNEFLLGERQKSVFSAYISALIESGFFPKAYNRQICATALNKLIPNLRMGDDGRTLTDAEHKSMFRQYFTKICTLIKSQRPS